MKFFKAKIPQKNEFEFAIKTRKTLENKTCRF